LGKGDQVLGKYDRGTTRAPVGFSEKGLIAPGVVVRKGSRKIGRDTKRRFGHTRVGFGEGRGGMVSGNNDFIGRGDQKGYHTKG